MEGWPIGGGPESYSCYCDFLIYVENPTGGVLLDKRMPNKGAVGIVSSLYFFPLRSVCYSYLLSQEVPILNGLCSLRYYLNSRTVFSCSGMLLCRNTIDFISECSV